MRRNILFVFQRSTSNPSMPTVPSHVCLPAQHVKSIYAYSPITCLSSSAARQIHLCLQSRHMFVYQRSTSNPSMPTVPSHVCLPAQHVKSIYAYSPVTCLSTNAARQIHLCLQSRHMFVYQRNTSSPSMPTVLSHVCFPAQHVKSIYAYSPVTCLSSRAARQIHLCLQSRHMFVFQGSTSNPSMPTVPSHVCLPGQHVKSIYAYSPVTCLSSSAARQIHLCLQSRHMFVFQRSTSSPSMPTVPSHVCLPAQHVKSIYAYSPVTCLSSSAARQVHLCLQSRHMFVFQRSTSSPSMPTVLSHVCLPAQHVKSIYAYSPVTCLSSSAARQIHLCLQSRHMFVFQRSTSSPSMPTVLSHVCLPAQHVKSIYAYSPVTCLSSSAARQVHLCLQSCHMFVFQRSTSNPSMPTVPSRLSSSAACQVHLCLQSRHMFVFQRSTSSPSMPIVPSHVCFPAQHVKSIYAYSPVTCLSTSAARQVHLCLQSCHMFVFQRSTSSPSMPIVPSHVCFPAQHVKSIYAYSPVTCLSSRAARQIHLCLQSRHMFVFQRSTSSPSMPTVPSHVCLPAQHVKSIYAYSPVTCLSSSAARQVHLCLQSRHVFVFQRNTSNPSMPTVPSHVCLPAQHVKSIYAYSPITCLSTSAARQVHLCLQSRHMFVYQRSTSSPSMPTVPSHVCLPAQHVKSIYAYSPVTCLFSSATRQVHLCLQSRHMFVFQRSTSNPSMPTVPSHVCFPAQHVKSIYAYSPVTCLSTSAARQIHLCLQSRHMFVFQSSTSSPSMPTVPSHVCLPAQHVKSIYAYSPVTCLFSRAARQVHLCLQSRHMFVFQRSTSSPSMPTVPSHVCFPAQHVKSIYAYSPVTCLFSSAARQVHLCLQSRHMFVFQRSTSNPSMPTVPSHVCFPAQHVKSIYAYSPVTCLSSSAARQVHLCLQSRHMFVFQGSTSNPSMPTVPSHVCLPGQHVKSIYAYSPVTCLSSRAARQIHLCLQSRHMFVFQRSTSNPSMPTVPSHVCFPAQHVKSIYAYSPVTCLSSSAARQVHLCLQSRHMFVFQRSTSSPSMPTVPSHVCLPAQHVKSIYAYSPVTCLSSSAARQVHLCLQSRHMFVFQRSTSNPSMPTVPSHVCLPAQHVKSIYAYSPVTCLSSSAARQIHLCLQSRHMFVFQRSTSSPSMPTVLSHVCLPAQHVKSIYAYSPVTCLSSSAACQVHLCLQSRHMFVFQRSTSSPSMPIVPSHVCFPAQHVKSIYAYSPVTCLSTSAARQVHLCLQSCHMFVFQRSTSSPSMPIVPSHVCFPAQHVKSIYAYSPVTCLSSRAARQIHLCLQSRHMFVFQRSTSSPSMPTVPSHVCLPAQHVKSIYAYSPVTCLSSSAARQVHLCLQSRHVFVFQRNTSNPSMPTVPSHVCLPAQHVKSIYAYSPITCLSTSAARQVHLCLQSRHMFVYQRSTSSPSMPTVPSHVCLPAQHVKSIYAYSPVTCLFSSATRQVHLCLQSRHMFVFQRSTSNPSMPTVPSHVCFPAQHVKSIYAYSPVTCLSTSAARQIHLCLQSRHMFVFQSSTSSPSMPTVPSHVCLPAQHVKSIYAYSPVTCLFSRAARQVHLCLQSRHMFVFQRSTSSPSMPTVPSHVCFPAQHVKSIYAYSPVTCLFSSAARQVHLCLQSRHMFVFQRSTSNPSMPTVPSHVCFPAQHVKSIYAYSPVTCLSSSAARQVHLCLQSRHMFVFQRSTSNPSMPTVPSHVCLPAQHVKSIYAYSPVTCLSSSAARQIHLCLQSCHMFVFQRSTSSPSMPTVPSHVWPTSTKLAWSYPGQVRH